MHRGQKQNRRNNANWKLCLSLPLKQHDIYLHYCSECGLKPLDCLSMEISSRHNDVGIIRWLVVVLYVKKKKKMIFSCKINLHIFNKKYNISTFFNKPIHFYIVRLRIKRIEQKTIHVQHNTCNTGRSPSHLSDSDLKPERRVVKLTMLGAFEPFFEN